MSLVFGNKNDIGASKTCTNITKSLRSQTKLKRSFTVLEEIFLWSDTYYLNVQIIINNIFINFHSIVFYQ